MEKKRYDVIVYGRVQGVGFRYETARMARRACITGWVTNLPNGAVAACLEGEGAPLEELLRWLGHGPATARVDKVNCEARPFRGEFREFRIRY